LPEYRTSYAVYDRLSQQQLSFLFILFYYCYLLVEMTWTQQVFQTLKQTIELPASEIWRCWQSIYDICGLRSFVHRYSLLSSREALVRKTGRSHGLRLTSNISATQQGGPIHLRSFCLLALCASRKTDED